MTETSGSGPAEGVIKLRLASVRRHLKALSAQALMVTNMVHVRCLSGFTGSEAVLIISSRGRHLLVDSRYTTQAQKEAAGCKVVQVTRRPEEVAELVRSLGVPRLAFESDGMTHERFLGFRKAMKGIRLVRAGNFIRGLRARKSFEELRLIKRAAAVAARAFEDVLPLARPGMREREFAALLEGRMRGLGSGPAPFSTIVASGPRGSLPHGVASARKMKKGELVTVDFGSEVGGYQSDQTITFCLGRPGKRQRLIYDTVLKAHDLAIKAIRPGVKCKDVDKAARGHIAEKGFGQYFGHGLGHGVGLETHEEPVLGPRSKAVLEPGMVVTVEPGIYLPGFGGVRIEDMVVVCKDGPAVITISGGPLREL